MRTRAMKLLTALALLLALPLSLLGVGASLPGLYGDTYYAQLPRMYRNLTREAGKKIVVVGGSNVAFGLDSALLEQILRDAGYEYRVCPFGLYGAVGTSAMLDLSRETLNEGDIVILAVEPTSETMSDYFGAEAFWKCAGEAPELILPLSRSRKGMLVGSYVPYLQQRLEILRSGVLPEGQGVYGMDSFNDRCDLVYDRPGNQMPAGFDTGLTVTLSQVEISPAFAGQVEEYCRFAGKRGADVLMSFSPVNRSCLLGDVEEEAESFFRNCNETFHCPMISDPRNYILDSGWFYDSNFHLNTAGAEVRTKLLAQDLLVWLGEYGELELEWPRMPETGVKVESNATDRTYFTFAPTPDGSAWLVSGLTEEGQTADSLRLPAGVDGKAVVGFQEGALDGAAASELWVPETVEHLPDGLFRKMERLQRLMLEHRDSVCSLSENTFEGAEQLRIFVPRESYHLYRDGYGCETNLWTEYLKRIQTY